MWFRKQLSTCLFVWTLNYNDLAHLLMYIKYIFAPKWNIFCAQMKCQCAQMKCQCAQMKCQCAQMKCTAVYIFSYKDIILKCYMLYGSLSKYTHFFLFLFWWHQIFSFPFCFSLLVFPPLQWHIHIICSRENHHEKKISRYVAHPHTFQSVVLPT